MHTQAANEYESNDPVSADNSDQFPPPAPPDAGNEKQHNDFLL